MSKTVAKIFAFSIIGLALLGGVLVGAYAEPVTVAVAFAVSAVIAVIIVFVRGNIGAASGAAVLTFAFAAVTARAIATVVAIATAVAFDWAVGTAITFAFAACAILLANTAIDGLYARETE